MPKHDDLSEKLHKLGEIERHHHLLVEKVEKHYNAYRGVLRERSDAARWRSRMHPPYTRNTVETFVSNLVEDNLYFDVIPRSLMGESPIDPLTLLAGAEAAERLLNYQLDIERFKEKQRPFALQAAISGLTLLKTFWRYEESNGRVLRDDPGMAVLDVRDFIFPPESHEIATMPYCFHRVWKTFDELKDLQEKGIYQNINKLGKHSEGYRGHMIGERELENFSYERTRGKIEVLEYWTPDETCTIANRAVVISPSRPNPFNFGHLHNKYPFEACSSMPDLFRIPGVGEVELLYDIQEMIWSLLNQRLDNAELVSNAIIMLRSDLDDPDAYEFAPGEKWLVDDPSQIKWFEPNPQVSRGLLESEGMLRGDMQTVTGGMPLLSGAESRQIDQKTATGFSIITSLAQRLLVAKKQQFTWCYERMAEKWMAMSSQFLSGPRLIPLIGQDGALAFQEVFPVGDASAYRVKIRPTSESIIRQERRAEAQAKLQMALQVFPIMQATGTPLNLKAFVEDYLETFGELGAKEKYFSAQPQLLLGGTGGGGQGQPAGVTEPGTGFSSPQAVSPLAPSNPISLSPERFLQQLGAARGGANRS